MTPTPDAADTPPSRPSLAKTFFALPPIGSRWPAATRAGAAFLLPALVLLALDFGSSAPLASLGAFAVLYGEDRPYRIRWRVILLAGVLLVMGVSVMGALTRVTVHVTHGDLVVYSALLVISVITVFSVNALRTGPPAALFFVLSSAVASVAVRHGVSLGVLVVATCAGAVGALVCGMAPALFDRDRPQTTAVRAAIVAVDDYRTNSRPGVSALRQGAAGKILQAWSTLYDAAQTESGRSADANRSTLGDQLWEAHMRLHDGRHGFSSPPLPRPTPSERLREALTPASHAGVTALRTAVAATAGMLISVALGLGRPDWAIVSVVLVLQLGPDRIRGALRGGHRLAGTVVGLGLLWLLHYVVGDELILVVVLALLNFLIELTVVANYGLAVTFITPLALLIGTPIGDSLAEPIVDRLAETVIGVVLAVGSVWVIAPRAHRRTTVFTLGRVLGEISGLVAALAVTPPSQLLRARRDLQWDLIEAESVAATSAVDDPAWAAEHWGTHVDVCTLGYDTLQRCWQTAPDHRVDDVELSDLRHRTESLRARLRPRR
ncbi:FUSC family protein [Williamsia sterculiae]|uniref:Fusaric acid resistance protein-like n=1 Tax=Williamsia sterculiae TaxID=1344003 RepID=A0A1N7F614_9NOCA|nr:FUSC family protein [Williamsia sterculiae]SIR95749.1 Fusaric acid resistance protein-like [Williamsia sterculiae]